MSSTIIQKDVRAQYFLRCLEEYKLPYIDFLVSHALFLENDFLVNFDTWKIFLLFTLSVLRQKYK